MTEDKGGDEDVDVDVDIAVDVDVDVDVSVDLGGGVGGGDGGDGIGYAGEDGSVQRGVDADNLRGSGGSSDVGNVTAPPRALSQSSRAWSSDHLRGTTLLREENEDLDAVMED